MHRTIRVVLSFFAATSLALGLTVSSTSEAFANPTATPSTLEKRVACNAPVVRLRAKPTKASAEIGKATQGQTVTGTKTGTWFKLGNNRYIAYYYTCPAPKKAPPKKAPTKTPVKKAVTPKAGPKTQKRFVCNAPVVRLRAKPTKASAEIGKATQGQAVTGTKTGTWLKLGKNRYIAYYYTCATKEKASPKPAATKKQNTQHPGRNTKAPSRSASRPSLSTLMIQPTSTNGSRTGPFGQRLHPILRVWRLHTGVDIGNTCNKPIVATASGKVTFVGKTAGGGTTTVISHGQFAGVRHVETKYLHQSLTLVRAGQTVRSGQVIGMTGKTGLATSCHLHYSTYENGKPVDPQKYIGALTQLRNY